MSDKNQIRAVSCIIDCINSTLKLPQEYLDDTLEIYINMANKVVGRGRPEIIAGIIFIVCRQRGEPRTLKEISYATSKLYPTMSVTIREIGRAYKHIARKMGVKVLPVKPQEYVPRFCKMSGLPKNIGDKAIEILNNAYKIGTVKNYSPVGYAVASIYLASVLKNNPVTQKEISENLGISEVTTRHRCQEVCKALEIANDIEELEQRFRDRGELNGLQKNMLR